VNAITDGGKDPVHRVSGLGANPLVASRPRLRSWCGGYGLLFIVTLEAVTMGSGRLLMIGPLSLKMWLYVAAMAYTSVRMVQGFSFRTASILLVFTQAVLLLGEIAEGLSQGGRIEAITEDVKPLIYFPMLLFFEAVVRDVRDVKLIRNIIIIGGVLLSVIYMALLAAIASGLVSFDTFYKIVSANEEVGIVLRGNSGIFFYNGSLYICIAFIFLVCDNFRMARVFIAITVIGAAASGTRGYILALAIVALLYIALHPLSLKNKLLYFTIVTLMGVGLFFTVTATAGDKQSGDSLRLRTIRQVLDRSDLVSLAVGHGFGKGVPERPVHMEMSYLEIFHKQGAIGLLWWTSLILILVARYRRAMAVAPHQLVYPFLLSSVFVLVESFTNPFVNNPIGMSMLVMSLACLAALRTTTDWREPTH
jgi:hypothetical protein